MTTSEYLTYMDSEHEKIERGKARLGYVIIYLVTAVVLLIGVVIGVTLCRLVHG